MHFLPLVSTHLLLMLLCSKLLGQTFINGVVVDNEGAPVPFAYLTWQNGHRGTCCDSLGQFSYNTSENADTITVSAIGYGAAKVPSAHLEQGVSLTLLRNTYHIQEVVVAYTKHSPINLGYAWQPTSSCTLSGSPGSAVLVNIPNENRIYGQIQSVHIRLKRGKEKETLRLRIFLLPQPLADSSLFDLLPEPLVVPCTSNHLKVDVSRYQIPFPPQGISVAVQWVAEKGMVLNQNNLTYPLIKCTSRGKDENTFTGTSGTMQRFSIASDDTPEWLLNLFGRVQNASIGITVSQSDG